MATALPAPQSPPALPGRGADPEATPPTFAAGLAPGFPDPVFDAQAVFRTVLDAMAQPGRPMDCPVPAIAPPEPLGIAAAAIALALADHETPLWLDAALRTPAMTGWLRFHCGAPITEEVERAAFALIAEPRLMPPFWSFAQGDDQHPERSATLIVEVGAFDGGPARRLRGPGIPGERRVAPAGVSDAFWAHWAANNASYPLGVDVIMTCGTRLMGLPRTSRGEG